ncbi:DUF3971 domain-containing protein [Alkalicaulis satelles]|uniref:DUF3971 domain-containing protein n=1 Tax=Alkalicaulis satelles TaxID=2609175 RepID=A0A5M6ZI07_9PROT|nr:DUF3971 domain-containing protein [Alkalicaulis satelles]KAA5804443.1 DUF3971 domain-containing protein [Alkalicaulis satelles]
MTAQPPHPAWRVMRLAVLYTLEAASVLLALVIVAGAAVLWRLAAGPVDAEPLRAWAADALVAALDGDRAEIGSLELRFDPALAAIVVTAREVSVRDEEGAALINARSIETALALDLLITGRAAPVRIAAEGGAFAFVRTASGVTAAGLGSPDMVEARGLAGAAPTGMLASQLGSGVLARLTEVDLTRVSLQVRDDITGASLIVHDARARLRLDEGAVEAAMAGVLVTSAGRAEAALDLRASQGLEDVFVDLRLSDVTPAAIAPRYGPLALLAGLDAPVRLELVLDASAGEGLRTAYIDLTAEPGEVRAGGLAFALEEAALRAAFDAGAGAIEISAGRIRSDLVTLDISGAITELSGFEDALPSFADYELRAGPGHVDPPGVFPEPVRWESISARGRIDRNAVRVTFDALEAAIPGAEARFTGHVGADETESGWRPALALDGPVSGTFSQGDILRHWPVDFALGARDWVSDAILAGALSEVTLDINLTGEALERGALEDDDLSLRFAFTDADVRYVSTMTPLRGLSGRAELRGNSLSLDGRGGRIGALEAETIFVEIKQLNPRGGPARFGGTGRGGVSDLIALLAEPPINLTENYDVTPDAFSGRGAFEFEIERPMLRHVPPEDLKFSARGRFTDVIAETGYDDLAFEEGEVEINASQDRLTAVGTARLAGARSSIEWTETFGLEPAAASSAMRLTARMDGRHLDALGLPVRQYLDGTVGVDASITGRGLAFEQIEVALDLEDAEIALPGDLWEKPAGKPAAAELLLTLGEAEVSLERFTLQGEGMDIEGAARLAPDGRLISADAPRLQLVGRADLAARADRPRGEDGPLRFILTGAFLDSRDLLSFGGPDAGPGGPLILEAAIDDVRVRGVRFEGVDFSLETGEDHVEAFRLDANMERGPVSVALTPEPSGVRKLSAEGPDAGQLLTAFAGYDNITGGALRLTAEAPPAGEPGGFSGSVSADAFTLERMPLLTRILAAGSLEGLASLLGGGQGIEFERLRADFVWDEGVLELREARAAGPSLGVTWSGVVNMSDARLDVDGTLLPSYGLNSLLGGLPIIGGLLTSRAGEGVIGITFSVGGPFNSARVSANPLSALAPGVLRRIFEGTSAERELDALDAARRARAAERAEGDSPPPEDEADADEGAEDPGADPEDAGEEGAQEGSSPAQDESP